MTPLHAAAEQGRSQVVGILVDKGADTNTKDKYGVSTCTCMCDYATADLTIG